ncbi:hypothetical protein [Geopseudomonas aromaticivorans]
MLKRCMLGMTLVVAAASAHAGPFGLEMGQSLAELKSQMKLVENGKYVYKSLTPPKAHSAFEGYFLVITPKHGLCRVRAIGRDVTTSAYGSELVSKVNDLQAAVTSRYGVVDTKFDFLRKDSIWNKPNDWMMGLYKKERSLAVYWGDDNKELVDNVASIELEANATSPSVGYANLTYDFTNAEECMNWVNAQENESL